MKWLDIKNAPKDGTPIILANFHRICLVSGCAHIGSGYWHSRLGWVSAAGSDSPEEHATHWAWQTHPDSPTGDAS